MTPTLHLEHIFKRPYPCIGSRGNRRKNNAPGVCRVVQNNVHQFHFCDNFCKRKLILTVFHC